MSSKPRKYYFELLNEFFDSSSIKLFRNKSKFYWPIIRIQTLYFLFLLSDNKIDPNSIDNKFKFEKKPLKFNEFKYLVKLFVKINIKSNLRNTFRNKVLVVGYQAHYYQQESQKINKYTTPIIEELKINAIPYQEFLISYDSAFMDKSEIENIYKLIYTYNHIVFKIKNIFFSTNKKYYTIALLFKNFLDKKHIPNSEHIANLIYKTQIAQDLEYETFKKLFRITKPKLIWTYCYYDNKMTAIIRAANSLGIKNIEYQHSIISDEHQSYAKWQNTDSYKDFFPNVFWVWEKNDADKIKQNFSGIYYQPNLIVGGNIAVIQEKEKNNKKEEHAGKGILVSLQGEWIPNFLERVIENDDEHKWYFRLHPRYPQDKNKLIDFKRKFPAKVEVDEANNLPLFQVFSKVMTNVGDFSGVALEAEQFGLKNIIIGKRGQEVYKEKINSGFFSLALDETQFMEKVYESKSKSIGFVEDGTKNQRGHLNNIITQLFYSTKH